MDRMTRALILGALLLATPARADDAPLAAMRDAAPACEAKRCVGLRLHVTVGEDDAPIATPDWLATQLANANRLFAAVDIGFRIVSIEKSPARGRHIANRRDRNQLAAGGLRGADVHVFIVGQLDDVDVPGETRFGVAWRAPGSERKYVILSTAARERVLAHELGHVFGLPHSKYAVSIMNKTERAEPPPEQRRFADEELPILRATFSQLLKAGWITSLDARATSPRVAQ